MPQKNDVFTSQDLLISRHEAMRSAPYSTTIKQIQSTNYHLIKYYGKMTSSPMN